MMLVKRFALTASVRSRSRVTIFPLAIGESRISHAWLSSPIQKVETHGSIEQGTWAACCRMAALFTSGEKTFR